jgi:RES domain
VRLIAYRHAAYDTPWRVAPSPAGGRFHRPGDRIVQYLCLHPLGPAAEMLRHIVGPDRDPDHLVLNLWVARLDVDATVVSFANCHDWDITPDQLVGQDSEPTRELAERVSQDGHEGMIVPSAALPGTQNLVLFGPRLLQSYLMAPLSSGEVSTGHLTDGARSVAEVVPLVRWLGEPHPALEMWVNDRSSYVLMDPPAVRW